MCELERWMAVSSVSEHRNQERRSDALAYIEASRGPETTLTAVRNIFHWKQSREGVDTLIVMLFVRLNHDRELW